MSGPLTNLGKVFADYAVEQEARRYAESQRKKEQDRQDMLRQSAWDRDDRIRQEQYNREDDRTKRSWEREDAITKRGWEREERLYKERRDDAFKAELRKLGLLKGDSPAEFEEAQQKYVQQYGPEAQRNLAELASYKAMVDNMGALLGTLGIKDNGQLKLVLTADVSKIAEVRQIMGGIMEQVNAGQVDKFQKIAGSEQAKGQLVGMAIGRQAVLQGQLDAIGDAANRLAGDPQTWGKEDQSGYKAYLDELRSKQTMGSKKPLTQEEEEGLKGKAISGYRIIRADILKKQYDSVARALNTASLGVRAIEGISTKEGVAASEALKAYQEAIKSVATPAALAAPATAVATAQDVDGFLSGGTKTPAPAAAAVPTATAPAAAAVPTATAPAASATPPALVAPPATRPALVAPYMSRGGVLPSAAATPATPAEEATPSAAEPAWWSTDRDPAKNQTAVINAVKGVGSGIGSAIVNAASGARGVMQRFVPGNYVPGSLVGSSVPYVFSPDTAARWKGFFDDGRLPDIPDRNDAVETPSWREKASADYDTMRRAEEDRILAQAPYGLMASMIRKARGLPDPAPPPAAPAALAPDGYRFVQ